MGKMAGMVLDLLVIALKGVHRTPFKAITNKLETPLNGTIRNGDVQG